jgi:ATP-binding cassette, subfamily B, bacterial MsbA
VKRAFTAIGRILSLGAPHRLLLVWASFGMVALAIATAAFAYVLGPVLRFVLTGGTSQGGFVAKQFPFLFKMESLTFALPALIVVIGLVKGAGYFAQFYWVGLFAQKTVVDLRRNLFERFVSLNQIDMSQQRVGDLVGRLLRDVAVIEQAATYTVASWIRDSLAVVALGTVAFALSPLLFLCIAIIVPLIMWPTRRLTGRLVEKTKLAQSAQGQLLAHVQEGVSGIRTIQSYTAAPSESAFFSKQSVAMQHNTIKTIRARAAVPALMEVFAAGAIACILVLASRYALVAPDVLLSFLSTLVLLYQPAKDLGRVTQFATAAQLAFERIDLISPIAAALPDGQHKMSDWSNQIELQHISFSWKQVPTLIDINLKIQKGETIVIMGESGSGKSTLAKLLLRMIDPTSGRFLLDNKNVNEFTRASIRSHMALVTQHPQIFSGSIRENLLLPRPQASTSEIEVACQQAGIDFLDHLPQGLNTQIGERGTLLSQGQVQRICIARALLSRAPILVFDEPTASLDAKSAQIVEATIAACAQERTTIVIAHSLKLRPAKHRLVVMQAGRIIENA